MNVLKCQFKKYAFYIHMIACLLIFFYILIFNLIFLIYSITFKISLIFSGLKVNRIRVLEKEEKLWILKTNTKIQVFPEKTNYSVSNDHWLDFFQTTQ